MLSKFDIRGFVFHGGYDGYVAIVRDFSAIIPVSYSDDYGKTWKKDKFSKDSFDKISNSNDPIIFLGRDAGKYLNPKTFRVINGYMRVQRKEDGLYNFISAEDHELLSPFWFKAASNMSDNQKALVIDTDNNRYYVGPYGCYENEDDEYAFKDFYDDVEFTDDEEDDF
jgi:hypothetical protein